ncbi:MAG: TonB-dependent receptor domain-containing protein [Chitinispirillaceae bacterium]
MRVFIKQKDTERSMVASVVTLTQSSFWSSKQYVAVSDLNGLASFDTVAPGTYSLTIEMTGFKPYKQKKVAIQASQTDSISISLEKQNPYQFSECDTCPSPSLIIGKVTNDETGEPVMGAAILTPDNRHQTTTDADGVFNFTDVAEGSYDLVISHPDYHSDTVYSMIVKKGQAINVINQLVPLLTINDKTGTIVGTVGDTATSGSIAKATVSLLNTDYTAQTQADGSYQLKSIPPGTYSMMITKWGYETEVITGISVRAKETVYQNAFLSSRQAGTQAPDGPGTISGIVSNSAGDPLEQAQVVVRETGDWARTDHIGRFRIDSIVAGVYSLVVAAEGYDTTVAREVDVWKGEETTINISVRTVIGDEKEHISVSGDEAVVTGLIVNGEDDTPVTGVAVSSDNGKVATVTDFAGRYVLRFSRPATYTISVTHTGFQQKQTEVTVDLGEKKVHDFVIQKSDVTEMQRMTVRSVAVKNTDASLLKQRKESFAVSDAIGADEIGKSGAGDAADAMKQVTGASVVGGKYVLIRGLGDRYTNTLLNGALLPSPDPDKKTFPADLFPTSLMDNIVIQKNFSPDKPGNTTGGSVNIQTKSFPEEFDMSVSASMGYNTGATFSDNFLSYEGGKLDWLGIDDGTRQIPDLMKDVTSRDIPSEIEARFDSAQALKLDAMSNSFSTVFYPEDHSAPPNYGLSFSLGNQNYIGRYPLGYLASLTYSRSYSQYIDGIEATYQLVDSDLVKKDSLSDHQSTSEVMWGALATLTLKLPEHSDIGFDFFYNRIAEDKARFLMGTFDNMDGGWNFETHTIHYTERDLNSIQIHGTHTLSSLDSLSLNWRLSRAQTKQSEPDVRSFSYEWGPHPSRDDTTYLIDVSGLYDYPTRFFRTLTESNYSLGVDLSYPFYLPWHDLRQELKIGFLGMNRDREFRVRQFKFQSKQSNLFQEFDGDLEGYTSPENIGIVDSAHGRYTFAQYVTEIGKKKSSYNAYEKVPAVYVMLNSDITERFTVSGGLRYEGTRMHIANLDTVTDTLSGRIDEDDFLPALSARYTLMENMNLRVAYGRTVARPSLREMAPFASQDFPRGKMFNGNPLLQRSTVQNMDVRWEWFRRAGEVLAVGGFYKSFDNPIQLSMSLNKNVTPVNVKEGKIYGVEVEGKTQLDLISPLLSSFSVGGNLAIIGSSVDLGEREKELAGGLHKDRPFQGQSPYLVNLFANYDNDEQGIKASLYFNMFGPRLSAVSLGNTPDVYEHPQKILNASLSKKLSNGIRFKLAAKNLLDSPEKMTYDQFDLDEKYSEKGRSFSLGIGYDF